MCENHLISHPELCISHVNGKYPRSENWCENNIFWSKIGSGLANHTATLTKNSHDPPPPQVPKDVPFTQAWAKVLPEGVFNRPKCACSVYRIDQSFRKACVYF